MENVNEYKRWIERVETDGIKELLEAQERKYGHIVS